MDYFKGFSDVICFLFSKKCLISERKTKFGLTTQPVFTSENNIRHAISAIHID